MEEEDLIKAVEQEISWLKYYADAKSRALLDTSKPLYDQLVSIGYTKRVVDLDMRCGFVRLTAPTPVAETPIEDLVISTDRKNPEKNVYTALEVYMMKYPEQNSWVKHKLQ